MAFIEKTRAENESALWWEIEALKKVNSDQRFDNENKQLRLESLQQEQDIVKQEIGRMKDSFEKSKDEFISQMKSENNRMIDAIDELRKKIDT